MCKCLYCIYKNNFTYLILLLIISRMLKHYLFLESLSIVIYYLHTEKEYYNNFKYSLYNILILLLGLSRTLLSPLFIKFFTVQKLQNVLYPTNQNEKFFAYSLYAKSNNLSECGYYESSILISKLILMSGLAGYVKIHHTNDY